MNLQCLTSSYAERLREVDSVCISFLSYYLQNSSTNSISLVDSHHQARHSCAEYEYTIDDGCRGEREDKAVAPPFRQRREFIAITLVTKSPWFSSYLLVQMEAQALPLSSSTSPDVYDAGSLQTMSYSTLLILTLKVKYSLSPQSGT